MNVSRKGGIFDSTRFLAPLRNDSGSGITAFALSGTFPRRPFVVPCLALGLPLSHSLSCRPSPAVISTNGRDLKQPSSAPRKASSAPRDFSLRFEMTAGAASRPSPYRELSPAALLSFPALPSACRLHILCHVDLPLLSSRLSTAVISTNGRDLKQPSSAPRKAFSTPRDFSLRFEMTAGAGSRPSPYRELSPAALLSFPALPLACRLHILCHVDLPPCHRDLPLLSCRLSPAVISTNGRDLKQPSSAPRKASSTPRDFSLRFEMTEGA